MATITLDLNKNPDLKDLVATMSVGDQVRLETSIKSKDDQTLQLTLESAEEGEAMESDDDDEDLDEPEGNGQNQTDPEEAVPPAPPSSRTTY